MMRILQARLLLAILAAPGALFAGTTRGEEAAPCACPVLAEKDGFGVLALLTDDPDWRAKWNTPPEFAPEIPPAGKLMLGDRATLLVMFANPAMQHGRARLECDLRLEKADGTVLTGGPSTCFDDAVVGPPKNWRLTGMGLEVLVDETEPSGVWRADIGVHDTIRNVRVPLSLSFEVDGSAAVGQ